MRILTAMLYAATIIGSSAAVAAENAPAAAASPPATAAETAAPDHEFRLGTAFGGLYSKSDKYDLSSYHFLFRPEYEWSGRLVITGLLRLTTTTLEMREPSGMPFDAKLTLPWQVSLGGGLRYRVWSHRFVDFSLYGEFEFPLGQNEANIDSFALKGEAAAFMPEVDTLRRHVRISHIWRRLAVGTTIRGHFGRWRPFIDLGYVNGENRIAASFDQEASDLFAQAKVSPQRFYDNDQSSFAYATGTDVEVGHGIRLQAWTTIIPTSDGVYFNGQIGAVFPIDIPTTWK